MGKALESVCAARQRALKRLRALRVAQRSGEIGVRPRPPRAPLGRESLIPQMPGRDLRAQGGAPAHVEMHQRRRGRIAGRGAVAPDQALRDRRRAQPGALEREKRDLLRRIEPAKIAIELEAIDHTDTR